MVGPVTLEELDEAEPDRIDPPGPASSEDAHRAALAAQQEWDLPQWSIAGRVAWAVQPGEQPGVVEIREPVQTFPERSAISRVPCSARLRPAWIGVAASSVWRSPSYDVQGDVQVHCLRLS